MQTHKSFYFSFCFLRDSPTFLSLPIHNHMHTCDCRERKRDEEIENNEKSVTMNDDETFVVVFSRLARARTKKFWQRRQSAATTAGGLFQMFCPSVMDAFYIWPPIIHVGTTNRVPFLVLSLRFLFDDGSFSLPFVRNLKFKIPRWSVGRW
jgi:hypothetical protein